MSARLERLLTSQELADLLRVPVGTTYSWRYKRTGPPAMRIGKHTRYRETDVLHWLEQLGEGG